ncbi:hypothetical protein C2E23DRAFT_882160 [Lenzites betulinus]|nr:hypothetical protein C2E23DRAFT_882160 [Lenzites betulinus]
MSAAAPGPLFSLPPSAHPKITRLLAVDMEHDRLARACGQGPILACPAGTALPSASASSSSAHLHGNSNADAASTFRPTHLATPRASLVVHADDPLADDPFALAWGLRPRATSVRVSQRAAAHLPSRPRSTSQPASIPVFAPPGPRGVLRSLRDLLQREGRVLEECLDVRAVLVRWEGEAFGRGETVHPKTFGAPVGVAVRCAWMSTVLGGYQHNVPWVVYACVEELNRTGIYQPGLFRSVPNRTRLARLIESFDMCTPSCASSPNGDGICPRMAPTLSTTRASLRKETTPDVCALLKTYLDLLPEPLLDENLAAALHLLCRRRLLRLARPPALRPAAHRPLLPIPIRLLLRPRSRPAPSVPMTPSEALTQQLALEAPQIAHAQHLLRLVPPAPLALLTYLLGFFTQLPLCPDNGMALADVARMFARVLVGGANGQTRECVQWLLERWPRVSDGLFDGVEDEQGGRGYADSAPATACKSTFDAWAPPVALAFTRGSSEDTPRVMQDVQEPVYEEDEEVGASRGATLMPYDPGLRERGYRSHSTSVSSTSSSATTASVESEVSDFDDAYAPIEGEDGGRKDDVEIEVAAREYELEIESESVYRSLDLDRLAHIPLNFRLGLGREYASCPPSPRHFARYNAAPSTLLCNSPPASTHSADFLEADVESSWDGLNSGSTSRCSPLPLPRGVSPSQGYSDSDSGCESGQEFGDGTPRNSACFSWASD